MVDQMGYTSLLETEAYSVNLEMLKDLYKT